MQAVEFEEEEFFVAVAVGGAGHSADLVVDALHPPAGDGMVEVVEDAGGMGAQRLGQALHLADAAVQGALAPTLQEDSHGFEGLSSEILCSSLLFFESKSI